MILTVGNGLCQTGAHPMKTLLLHDRDMIASVAENQEALSGQSHADDTDVDDDFGFEIEEDAGLADALDAVEMADNLWVEEMNDKDYGD